LSKPENYLLTVTATGPGAAEFLDAVRIHAATLGIRPLSTAFHAALEEVGTAPAPQLLAVPQLLSMGVAGHG